MGFELKVDLRTSATIAALNSGVMNSSDLLEVTDMMYFLSPYDYDDDYEYDDNYYSYFYFGEVTHGENTNYTVAFDPKYPEMSAVYYSNEEKMKSRKYVQRLGKTMWNVEYSGYYYDEAYYSICPEVCNGTYSSMSGACSTPDYVFKYTELNSNNTFGLNLYSSEMYTINMGNMDLGRIGCATTTDGSDGNLGRMEPKSAAEFQANFNKNPFKLTENYYACTPEPADAFLDSVGIAQGNAALFLTLLMALISSCASIVGFMKASAVSDYDIETKTVSPSIPDHIYRYGPVWTATRTSKSSAYLLSYIHNKNSN